MNNALIPMMVRSPDVLGNMLKGAQLAGLHNGVGRQNRLMELYREQGPGIANGDANALNALATLDPTAAQNAKAAHQDMSVQSERLTMARQQAARQAAIHVQALDEREAAREAKVLENAIAAALAAETQEQLDGFLQQTAPELMGQVTLENRDMYVAQAFGLRDALKMVRGPEDPAAMRTLRMRAQESGLTPGTQRYEEFMFHGGAGGSDSGSSEAEREIDRLMSLGMPRDTAVRIKEGVYRTTTDPLTRQTQVIDLSTGQLVFGGDGQPSGTTPSLPVATGENGSGNALGPQFQNADQAFGVGGAARRAVNTVSDATLGQTPFPETRQAQTDFAVFGESLVNAFASAYGRQPPSWLLKNIEGLTPRPGVLEGPGAAQDKLQSMARDLEARRSGLARSASRKTSPKTREDLEGQIAGIDATLSQIYSAMAGFSGGDAQTTSGGVKWKVLD